MTFELLVATRYLRARRKQAVISIITFIAILGVGAGVAALVVAMAVSAGQREDIQSRLFGAQAHLTVFPSGPMPIRDYLEITKKIEQVDGVVAAAPHAASAMAIRGGAEGLNFVSVKGAIPELEEHISKLTETLIKGRLTDLKGNTIIVGKQLAEDLGVTIGDRVTVFSGALTAGARGIMPTSIAFTVVGIYSIGLFEYDAHLVYVPFERAAYLINHGDTASNIEVKVSDINRTDDIGAAIFKKLGPGYVVSDWKELNKPILQALSLERLGMAIAIGLIVFVAALNIVAMLTMMVLDKTRDIAALMAMGATVSQIRRIFILQGLIIGVIGTSIGLVLGHLLSYFADKFQLIKLNPDVYSIDHLPFHAVPIDSIVIAAAAILISFLATLYPSAAAARLEPVEALRYE